MALVKCSECGNKVSDRAEVCVHCGCPMDEIVKFYCEDCGEEVKKTDKACKNCGCPVKIIEKLQEKEETSVKYEEKKVKKDNLPDVDYYDEEFEIVRVELNDSAWMKYKNIYEVVAWISLIGFLAIFPPIYCWLFYFLIKGCKNNELILTNKRIKGKVKTFGNIANINIPLDRVDSIETEVSVFRIDTVKIQSSSNIKTFLFALNGDEFCKRALEEIERYKRFMFHVHR